MKKFLKGAFATLSLALFAACTNDIEAVASLPGDYKLNTPSVSKLVLLEENADKDALTLTWESPNFGVNTLPKYVVQFAKEGTNFAAPIDLISVSTNTVTVTTEYLNKLLVANEFELDKENQIEFRILATLGDWNPSLAYNKFSNSIKLVVSPYDTAFPMYLAVPGSHQEWKPGNAPQIASSAEGKRDHEGYVWLTSEYKFVAPDANGVFAFTENNKDWGDKTIDPSSFELVADGEKNCKVDAEGYYLLRLNFVTMKYTATEVVWGIAGDATGSWDNSTDMTYNSVTKVWEVTATLEGGKEMKFRANNNWDINLGSYQSDKKGAGEEMSYGGGNIKVANSGTYKITLDLSNPRNYKYTITPVNP